MSRRKRVARNTVALVILSWLFLSRSGLYLSAISAHEHSERSAHYGPSEVVHIEDFPGGKFILGKYDKWISCNTINRALLLFWRFGDQPTGIENDGTKSVVYNWGVRNESCILYGIINDPSVKRIEVTLTDGTAFSQTEFYDDMFLFTWEVNDSNSPYARLVRGYDAAGNVVFEEKTYY